MRGYFDHEDREFWFVSVSKSLSLRERRTLANVIQQYIKDYEGINREADLSCKATGCPCEDNYDYDDNYDEPDNGPQN